MVEENNEQNVLSLILALASLALSFLGCLCLGFIGSIPAAALSTVALIVQSKKYGPDRNTNMTLSIISLAGAIAVSLLYLFILMVYAVVFAVAFISQI